MWTAGLGHIAQLTPGERCWFEAGVRGLCNRTFSRSHLPGHTGVVRPARVTVWARPGISGYGWRNHGRQKRTRAVRALLARRRNRHVLTETGALRTRIGAGRTTPVFP